ncbi:MAG TPA: GNAT family N-acetyltransferase [Flavipsychrobacter sp.]|nr:GNAT family N-acetyltransferase [Flavipsychrobacter sp.]
MIYHIEPVSEKYLPALTDIMNHYILNTTVSFYKEPLRDEEMMDKLFFNQPYYQSFIIRDEQRLIGYCAVSQWKKQEAYRHSAEINIYLHKDFMGKGIGSIILAHAERFAKLHDIHTLIAGLCSENIPSKKLFEKNGYNLCAHFEKVGYKFDRELDVIYLQKFLR